MTSPEFADKAKLLFMSSSGRELYITPTLWDPGITKRQLFSSFASVRGIQAVKVLPSCESQRHA